MAYNHIKRVVIVSAVALVVFVSPATAQDGDVRHRGDIELSQVDVSILSTTPDASDTSELTIGGGGAAADTRGAYITLAGNEDARTGKIALVGGNVSGGDITLSVAGSVGLTVAYDVKVGIRTAIPTAVLDVVTHAGSGPQVAFSRYESAVGGSTFRMNKARGTEATPLVVVAADKVGAVLFRAYDGSAFDQVASLQVSSSSVSGGSIGGEFVLKLSNAGSALIDRFFVDETGRVAVNSILPDGMFTVVSEAGDAATWISVTHYETGTAGGIIHMGKARGTEASPAVVVAGDRAGNLIAKGWDGSTFDNVSSIRTSVQSVSSGDLSGSLEIRVADTSGALQPRLTIDEAGLVEFPEATTQHLYTETNTDQSTTSTSFAAVTALVQAITTTNSSSEVCVTVYIPFSIARNNNSTNGEFRIQRDTTTIRTMQVKLKADEDTVGTLVLQGEATSIVCEVPGAGTFSYNVDFKVINGTNSEALSMDATGYGPAVIQVVERSQ